MADDRRKKLLTDRAEVYDGLGGDAAPEGKLVSKPVAHYIVDGSVPPEDALRLIEKLIDRSAKAERERILALCRQWYDGGMQDDSFDGLLDAIRGEA